MLSTIFLFFISSLCAQDSYTIYFAGPLFSGKDLIGNELLAREIEKQSEGRYLCLLPQQIEKRLNSAKEIRDEDIRILLTTDLAIFNFDGTELDSGTVVEFMIAKFADIPSLLLRTDFRHGGDQTSDPWNLMCSFYPRTQSLVLNAMALYKNSSSQMVPTIAAQCIEALDHLLKTPPLLQQDDANAVLRWLSQMTESDTPLLYEQILDAYKRRTKD